MVLGSLRKPFFVVALVLLTMAVLVELGSSLIESKHVAEFSQLSGAVPGIPDDFNKEDFEKYQNENDSPPGFGIPSLALIDGLLLFTVLLMGLALLIPDRLHGRVQGIATFIVSLLIVIGAIVLIFVTLTLLMIMISLFLAAPFGTLAYLAIYGSFAKGTAAVALSLIMSLKLGFAVFLVLAHQRFLENKGLVVLVLTSLLASVIVSFLHAIVPGILVSITDAVAAIIVGILAAIWAIIFLVGSLVSVYKVLRIDRALS